MSGDADWAAGILTPEDLAELQVKGENAVTEAMTRKVFYLGVYKYVEDAKALVEAYAHVNSADLEDVDDSAFILLNDFMGQMMSQFYAMCVEYGNIEKGFWKQD